MDDGLIAAGVADGVVGFGVVGIGLKEGANGVLGWAAEAKGPSVWALLGDASLPVQESLPWGATK